MLSPPQTRGSLNARGQFHGNRCLKQPQAIFECALNRSPELFGAMLVDLG